MNMAEEKEYMATTTIAGKAHYQYDKTSPKRAYQKLLENLKQKGVRVSCRTFFIIRQIDYDPSHKTISYSLFSGYYGINGKKQEIEAMLSCAA